MPPDLPGLGRTIILAALLWLAIGAAFVLVPVLAELVACGRRSNGEAVEPRMARQVSRAASAISVAWRSTKSSITSELLT